MNQNYKLFIIANIIGKDTKNISKEIKRNRYLVNRKNIRNDCGLFNSCQNQRLSSNCENGYCKYCSANNCSTICDSFSSIPNCKTTNRFPYICNTS